MEIAIGEGQSQFPGQTLGGDRSHLSEMLTHQIQIQMTEVDHRSPLPVIFLTRNT